MARKKGGKGDYGFRPHPIHNYPAAGPDDGYGGYPVVPEEIAIPPRPEERVGTGAFSMGMNASASCAGEGVSFEYFGGGPASWLNMIHPAQTRWVTGFATQSGLDVYDHLVPANDISYWQSETYGPVDAPGPGATVDGTAVAGPEGDLTAYHLTETNINHLHYVTAGFSDTQNRNYSVPYRFRLAVYAKADERSRIGLQIGDATSYQGKQNRGVRAIFDLANGAVAVPAYVTSSILAYEISNWVAIGASITAAENATEPGWYLCILDAKCAETNRATAGDNLNNNIKCNIFVDSGAGGASESTTYSGDGTSGVLVDRTNLLPLVMWDYTDRVFFDDFDDASTVDVDNTKDEGFNWYTEYNWPLFTYDHYVQNLDINDTYPSILTQTGTGEDRDSVISTACYTGTLDGSVAGYPADPPNYVGTVFQLPFLAEAEMAHDQFYTVNSGGDAETPLGVQGLGGPTFWTDPLEAYLNFFSPPHGNLPRETWIEQDFTEWHFQGHTWRFAAHGSGQSTDEPYPSSGGNVPRTTYPPPRGFQAGTISVTEDSDMVTGSGTSFLSIFNSAPFYDTFNWMQIWTNAGDQVGVGATTDEYESYRVAEVLSNTSLRLETPVTFTRAAAPYSNSLGSRAHFTDNNLYSTFISPETADDSGMIISFYNGSLLTFCNYPATSTSGAGYDWTIADDHHYVMIIGGYTSKWDSVAVWKAE